MIHQTLLEERARYRSAALHEHLQDIVLAQLIEQHAGFSLALPAGVHLGTHGRVPEDHSQGFEGDVAQPGIQRRIVESHGVRSHDDGLGLRTQQMRVATRLL